MIVDRAIAPCRYLGVAKSGVWGDAAMSAVGADRISPKHKQRIMHVLPDDCFEPGFSLSAGTVIVW
ncbi:hypothetical protein BC938DRAFT_474298 [Jimgerdemannia flammicorona]|uniref:Uncharacterized protein n=1 Tax=Jimgerdemannia flammicorona TaxID=994334 RepID=A0A433Q2N4_9FUNG|nr:hypothetical protein BC938DRAFT_474298 [Jimgerdemannia flammicorona]